MKKRGPLGTKYSFETCRDFCIEEKMPFMGLQYGKSWKTAECWCTDDIWK